MMLHGYDGKPGWLEVSAEMDGPSFVVHLEDTAPEYDPTDVPEPDLSVPPMDRTPGGMEVHLIRACTDTMTYRPRPGGGNTTDPCSTDPAEPGGGGVDGAHDHYRGGRRPRPDHGPVAGGRARRVELRAPRDRRPPPRTTDGTRALLIDLSGLTFLASSGLVALH